MTLKSYSPSLSVQEKIESQMQNFFEEERWETIVLFSSEGLLLAACGSSETHNQDNLLEFAFSLIGTTSLLKNDLPVKEITIQSKGRILLVFRFFEAWKETLILAAVVRGRIGYKRAMGKLMKHIRDLYSESERQLA
jgi:hypothetical protein